MSLNENYLLRCNFKVNRMQMKYETKLVKLYTFIPDFDLCTSIVFLIYKTHQKI